MSINAEAWERYAFPVLHTPLPFLLALPSGEHATKVGSFEPDGLGLIKDIDEEDPLVSHRLSNLLQTLLLTVTVYEYGIHTYVL